MVYEFQTGLIVFLAMATVIRCNVIITVPCYVCASAENANNWLPQTGCGEEFRSETIRRIDCSGVCYKKYGQGSDKKGIVRGCESYPDTITNVCRPDEDGKSGICYCQTFLCNTGSRMTSSALGSLHVIVAMGIVRSVFY